jgi:hypothetical protein
VTWLRSPPHSSPSLPSAKGFGSKLNSQVGSGVKSSGSSLGKTFGKMFAASAGLIAAAGIGLPQGLDRRGPRGAEGRRPDRRGPEVDRRIANVRPSRSASSRRRCRTKIGVDDEAIQAGENLLLTFTNVRNEVGKGNDIFNRATRTVQDMAAAFGGDAVSNSKILGKALNDPIKGVSALTRVGVSFTDAAEGADQDPGRVGHRLDAQKIILGELTKETQGSAEAQVTAGDKAGVALGNLKETIGTALLPVIDRLANTFTTKVAPAITTFVGQIQTGTGAGGQLPQRGGGDRGTVAKDTFDFFSGLPGVVKSFGAEAAIAAVVVPKLTGAINGVGMALWGSLLAS